MIISPIQFYMIRHGESEANKGGYISGNFDSPLTALGRDQAKQAQSSLEKLSIKPRVIVHSHLSRARDTASFINEPYALPMHETQLLGEQKFGDWEKQPTEIVRKRYRDNGEDPPNGETHLEFRQRVAKGLEYAFSIDKPALIVCHGGVFRAFYALYGKTIQPTENCKLYSFTPIKDPDFPWDVQPVD